MPSPLSRRAFLASTAATFAAPAIVRAASRVSNDEAIVGEGDYQYRVTHHYPQLPDRYTWQTTHNVAIDSQNQL